MLGELIPVGGGDPIPLVKEKLLIGRRESCDISLQFPNVSSHHCELEFRDGFWFVTDLRSRNGTKVNGTRVSQKWLAPGDEISVAKHMFELQYTAEGNLPPELVGDEFDSSKSLMEKAGLERRNGHRKPARGPLPPAVAPLIPESAGVKSDSDESLAVEWLTDGEDNDDAS